MNESAFALAPVMSRKKKQRLARAAPDLGKAFIYFIENRGNGQVKIGRTNSIGRRIKGITSSKGADKGEYAILGYITVATVWAAKLESELHRWFADHRASGEWFNLAGQNLLDAAIRASKSVAVDSFEIAGLATEAPQPDSVHGEANSGIYWKRNKGNGRAPRIL